MLAPEIARLGRSGFVWKFGVLGFGLPTALLGSVVYFLARFGLEFSVADVAGLLIPLVLVLLIVGLLGGYVWGRLYWALAQRSSGR
jgi:hypothetical protein